MQTIAVVFASLLLVTMSYLWWKPRRLTTATGLGWDDLVNPILIIDLNTYKPTRCNRQFHHMLGYRSAAECLDSLRYFPHFPEHTFHQIFRLTDETGSAGHLSPDIPCLDRFGTAIGLPTSVSLNKADRYMQIKFSGQLTQEKRSEPPTEMSATQIDDRIFDSPLLDCIELWDGQVGVWSIDIGKGTLLHNDRWLSALGYGSVADRHRLQFWTRVIAPAERDRLVNFFRDAGGDELQIRYRVATAGGVEIELESRGLVTERDTDGQILKAHGIHIARHQAFFGQSANESTLTSTADLAARLGLSCSNNIRFTTVPDLDFLGGLLRLLLTYLNQEAGRSVMPLLDVKPLVERQCSSCSSVTAGTDLVAITLNQTGLRVDSTGLPRLLQSGYATAHIGARNLLHEVSRELHGQAGHIQLALIDGCLIITLLVPGSISTVDARSDLRAVGSSSSDLSLVVE